MRIVEGLMMQAQAFEALLQLRVEFMTYTLVTMYEAYVQRQSTESLKPYRKYLPGIHFDRNPMKHHLAT